MKAKTISFLTALAAIGLTRQASAARFEDSSIPAKDVVPAAAAPKTVIGKGMTAEEIVRVIGQPREIVKLQPENAKAERWTYRQLVKHKVVEEATTTGNEMAFVGNGGPGNNAAGSRVVMQYSTKDVSIYRYTALLMVDHKLVLARQWDEQQVHYE